MLRRITCVIVAVLLGLGLLGVPASAADQARLDSPYYLALGDSLAFGYQPTRDFTQGYVNQLYAILRDGTRHDAILRDGTRHAGQPRLQLMNLGCPGETSATLRTGGVCRYPGSGNQFDAALAFLRAHRGRVKFITIDIGGNDVNRCVSASGIDPVCVDQGLLAIAGNLSVIVPRLRAAAPYATIAGMTYYDPTLAAWLRGPAGQALAQQSLPLLHRLNRLLTAQFRAGHLRIADVAGAFATDDMTTMVNGVPLDVARICQWTWMCAPAPLGPDIHANTAGYGVIAQTFAAVL